MSEEEVSLKRGSRDEEKAAVSSSSSLSRAKKSALRDPIHYDHTRSKINKQPEGWN